MVALMIGAVNDVHGDLVDLVSSHQSLCSNSSASNLSNPTTISYTFESVSMFPSKFEIYIRVL